MKNATKIGVSASLRGTVMRGPKQGKLMRSKMGCLEAFENGVPMLRGAKRPVFERIGGQAAGLFLRPNFLRINRFHRGKTRFFGFKWLHLEQKKEAFLNRYGPSSSLSFLKSQLPDSFQVSFTSRGAAKEGVIKGVFTSASERKQTRANVDKHRFQALTALSKAI